MSAPHVSVRATIGADPLDIWAAVADPRRLTEWSPDSTAVRCSVAGPLPVGVSFSGSNRNGVFRWSTSSRVVESEPGRSFAFDVSFLAWRSPGGGTSYRGPRRGRGGTVGPRHEPSGRSEPPSGRYGLASRGLSLPGRRVHG